MLKHGRGTPFQTSYCQCGPILEAASWAAVPERSKLENINSNSHPNQCLPPHVDWIPPLQQVLKGHPKNRWKHSIQIWGMKWHMLHNICGLFRLMMWDVGEKRGGTLKLTAFVLFYCQLKKCTLTVLQKFGQVRWKWYRAKADDDYYLFLCEILSLMKWVFICSYLYFGLYFLYLCPWHWMGQTG